MQLPSRGWRLIFKETYVVGTVESIWFGADEKYWVFCRITPDTFFCCPLDKTKATKEVGNTNRLGKYLPEV